MKPWTHDGLAPKQQKLVQDKLRTLFFLSGESVHLSGVIGQSEHTSRVSCTAVTHPAAEQAYNTIGETYSWSCTPNNMDELMVTLDAAIVEARATIPIKDERQTPEQAAAWKAKWEAENQERERRDEVSRQKIAAMIAKAPPGAKALVIAEQRLEESDAWGESAGSSVLRRVAIGWRFTDKEKFRHLRKVAATFPETAHLGPDADRDIEHRYPDNHLEDDRHSERIPPRTVHGHELTGFKNWKVESAKFAWLQKHSDWYADLEDCTKNGAAR